MQPVSPVDAISPAFSRTRTILTPPGFAPGLNAPFRFWFFVKITVIAALTQGNIYGFVFGLLFEAVFVAVAVAAGLSGVHSRQPFFGGIPISSAPAIAAIGIAVLFALIIAILFTWLWCRLRFTLFDLVVYRHGLVSRAWSPYGSQAWRFLGLMLLIALGLLLLLAITAGPLVLHLIVAIRHLTPQELNNDPFLVLSHIFPIYGAIFLFALIAGLVNAMAQDFILPPMALEDAPVGSAFARFFHLLRMRFWYVALYMLLRFVIQLGLGMVGGLAVFLVLGVLGVGGAGAGFVLYRAFWHTGPGGVAIFVIFCVVAGLLLLAVYLLLILALYGVIAVVMQSYAAYFYGSYYPQLGDRLEPPPPTPPAQSLSSVPPNPLPPSAPA